MSGLPAVLIAFLFFMDFVNGDRTPAAQDNKSHVAINCGSSGDCIALDDSRWVREAGSTAFMSGESKSSIAATTLFHGA
ncbi:OLC1v1026244C1 [Oldenlandia corymbosa var. corymbosa]|uniref:OLC1v1026244C1 n=1 Tax=Oldenlandia corymbosa var. corymbosa TaxID=529605 RepID=A0AAV1C9E5_OLDCO|nr:OLC1v1026244C1 [Oldenlandia corymbosa var. corymbosa]